jgi:hypothetical protein
VPNQRGTLPSAGPFPDADLASDDDCRTVVADPIDETVEMSNPGLSTEQRRIKESRRHT